jgi:hypothetical protein
MIKTTSADKVQERRSESSGLCMGTLSAAGGYSHCDRDHKFPGSPLKTSSALQLRTHPIRGTAAAQGAVQPAGCAAPAALTAFCPKRCTAA